MILAWTGIGVTWSASCAVEILLLTEGVVVALAVTTTAALATGALVTRRLTTRVGRAQIKVRDLRAARPRRR